MILELDCGNSFVKWRVLKADGAVVSTGVVESNNELLHVLSAASDVHLRVCRVVSVRNEEETRKLTDLIEAAFSIPTHVALPAQDCAGVRNGYDDYQRLGMDRWVAILGAYAQAGGPCVVIDFGTAVTSDFVDTDGQHLGGYICPGLPLMRSQLRTHTRRIRYDDDSASMAKARLAPGTATVQAVERGCVLMLRGFVATQVEQATALWGSHYHLFLTGGDASLVSDVAPGARYIPDLVFKGLAIACPLP
ncbi:MULTISPECIES: pantothenate kinase [unclassified Pseudomonas]|uniref:pantothenate kinase n=1 Tax=unclassified Pseudomonas TaxID=196821 RepID=UPI000BC9667B|nr:MULTISPECIES: pantothenate kinase [unclassified Pseudomonas]PVZ08407.1 type III pantothenate kinase [Pseudomonas sp. URIL14HWK12:I12]PVZ21074.1 type III pantothenate kinase [Pseudomonas sp. URIL14HWK12:I10]PVZ29649.1 type III pantothenate kinase [Pseudomonas sp. URIL14HWK12:I11]SNZ18915.1 type III pantothenate kinase [Pseudomonas sp. URIL14HWK12:I9]